MTKEQAGKLLKLIVMWRVASEGDSGDAENDAGHALADAIEELALRAYAGLPTDEVEL